MARFRPQFSGGFVPQRNHSLKRYVQLFSTNMTYFSANYSNIKINIDEDGLRNAQIGAIHSICSHFTLKQTPALVVLPTGTGKTAVIVMSPYLLRAKRVLVLS